MQIEATPAVPGPGGSEIERNSEAFLHTGIGLKCFVLLKMKVDVPQLQN